MAVCSLSSDDFIALRHLYLEIRTGVKMMPRTHTYSLYEGDCLMLMRDIPDHSGSTGVVARLEKRSFIGMEKNHEYFVIAKSRIEKTIN